MRTTAAALLLLACGTDARETPQVICTGHINAECTDPDYFPQCATPWAGNPVAYCTADGGVPYCYWDDLIGCVLISTYDAGP